LLLGRHQRNQLALERHLRVDGLIMRDVLKPLEGQTVVYKGRLKEWRNTPDGTINVCLAAVQVWPLRTDVPLTEVKPVKVEHLWISGLQRELVQRTTMLQFVGGAGHCSYYARANGSADLGITSHAGMDLNQLLSQLAKAKSVDTRMRAVKGMLKEIDAGARYWDFYYKADQTLKMMRDMVAAYERSVAVEIGICLTSPRTGPCEKLRAADPFSALRSRKPRPSTAFA
jgi:hypothetical protein